MRAVIVAAVLLASVAAHAKDAAPSVKAENYISTFRCVERFPGLPKVAARLGIAPNQPSEGAVELMMCNGDRYSLFGIINAALDKIDASVGERKP